MDHTFHYFQFLFAYPTLTVVVVQSLSRVQFFVMPWTAACQASLSFTISHSLLKLISITLMIPSNHLVLCCPFSSCLQSFPASVSFLMSGLFASGGQSIGTSASASASALPMNIQGWFPLGQGHTPKVLSCEPSPKARSRWCTLSLLLFKRKQS